ncbi:MAG: Gfo/Idh/MocA family oxidoreductase [Verrucomicrobia bacterium]|nr:Gfo/Idh/MocA family oxidoreductase [Verrucomicrobiota bacterium]
MSSNEKQNVDLKVDRRTFLQSAAAAGASLALSGNALAQAVAQPAKPATVAGPKGIDDLNVGVIGLGAQGQVLIEAASGIPGVKFKAVCDIWEYHQKLVGGRLKKTGHDVKLYEDYRELLAQEKDLDAVVVATPDWMHAEIANACMEAGKHVYCEKEMSNNLEKARSMVATQRKTGKLLQIGHQRRSNPRYIHAIDRLIREAKLLGRVTHAYAQWNRSVADPLGWPKKYAIEQAKLDKYGYVSMEQFRNWRWYKKYGGGPIVDLGSHQIDLFSWLWECNPSAIVAMGGADYYKGNEWYDNVMTIYEYHTPEGINRAYYQVLTTTKRGGFYEQFMGVNGALTISEVAARGDTVEREAHAPSWDEYAKKGWLKPVKEAIKPTTTRNVAVDVRVTAEAGKWPLPIELLKPAHQPHLENFFDAIRGRAKLNCPGEVAYETAVAVLKANDAVAAGRKMEFKHDEFKV